MDEEERVGVWAYGSRTKVEGGRKMCGGEEGKWQLHRIALAMQTKRIARGIVYSLDNDLITKMINSTTLTAQCSIIAQRSNDCARTTLSVHITRGILYSLENDLIAKMIDSTTLTAHC